MFESVINDIRYGVRTLSRAPTFTLGIATTLAIGLGSNVALYGVVRSVILEPLPYPNPERVVAVWETVPDEGPKAFRVTAGNYVDWRTRNTVFDGMAIFGAAAHNLTGRGEPEQVRGGRVSASYFRVLGVPAALGRWFLPEEDRPGGPRVVILDHGFWQRRFGGRTDVLGQTMLLDDEPFEIVGVMPNGLYPAWPGNPASLAFEHASQQYWIPLALGSGMQSNRRSHVFGVIARLAQGVSLDRASRDMAAIADQLAAEYPEWTRGEGAIVRPLHDEMVGTSRPTLFLLFGVAALVLLVVCANVAGLLLVRAVGRTHEMAIRAALGAARGRLVRQALVESLLMAGVGGLLAVAVAHVWLRLIHGFGPGDVPRLSEATVDLPVLVFTVLLSLVTGVACGLAPSWRQSSLAVRGGLTPRVTTPGHDLLRRGLIVGQVAVAVVIVISAGLLTRSLVRLIHIDSGFEPRHVLRVALELPSAPGSRYNDPDRLVMVVDELVERLRSRPDVVAAGVAYDHPLSATWTDSFTIEGAEMDPRRDPDSAWFRIISPGYFSATGTTIVRGRDFTVADDHGHPGAVIVNEAFASRYFRGQVPLGKQIHVSSIPSPEFPDFRPPWFEVVGVVENVRFRGPERPPEPAFYVPFAQFPVSSFNILLLTRGLPEALADAVRATVWSLDANVPVGQMETLERSLDAKLAPRRFSTVGTVALGAVAILLAAFGLYAVLSHFVAQRTREFGVRMALGARPRDVTRLVLERGLRLAGLGLMIGIIVAAAVARSLSALLFEVAPLDVVIFCGVPLTIGAIALVASYLPARRAVRLDPVSALRSEY